MKQTEITEEVLKRLSALASFDSDRWYPAHGWMEDDGSAHGLAHDLFGPTPSRPQVEKLGKALRRMGMDGLIEVALFRRRPDVKRLPSTPFRQGPHEYSGIGGSSGGILPGPNEYGVRLTRN